MKSLIDLNTNVILHFGIRLTEIQAKRFSRLWSKGNLARRQYDLRCQLSAMSLQAAIPEGDSEDEPLKPTDRQAINYKVKKLQDLKEKSEKLKSSIQKGNA